MLRKIAAVGLSLLLSACASTHKSDNIYPDSPMSKGKSNSDLGVRYLLGRGVVQNDVKAFYYFSQEAEEGNPFAQNEIAYMYAVGKGTSKNVSLAFYYYQKAAEQDLASAQYNLSLMYRYGIGIEPNKELELKWLNKSAAHGFEPAKQALLMG
jgi:TPR repeat protein